MKKIYHTRSWGPRTYK